MQSTPPTPAVVVTGTPPPAGESRPTAMADAWSVISVSMIVKKTKGLVVCARRRLPKLLLLPKKPVQGRESARAGFWGWWTVCMGPATQAGRAPAEAKKGNGDWDLAGLTTIKRAHDAPPQGRHHKKKLQRQCKVPRGGALHKQ